MSNSCSYCGFSYCSEHRLPEKHNCVSLATTNTLGPDFRPYPDVSDSAEEPEYEKNTNDREKCKNCSNYTTVEHDLCLECRRKERTISSRSPDVRTNGDLDKEEPDQEKDVNELDHNSGILSKLKSILFH